MMSNARQAHLAPRLALLLAVGITLSACGATIGKLPESLGGLPEAAPQRPAETMPFPNVYEPRPKREAAPLTAEEQKKLEADLSELRDSQNRRANPPPPAAKLKAAKAPVKKQDGNKAKNAAAKNLPAKKKNRQDDVVVPEQTGPAGQPKLIN
jgi:hypothetical protein